MPHAFVALLLAAVVAACYLLVDRPAAFWVRTLDPQVVFVFKKITVLGSSGPYLVCLAALYLALRFYFRKGEAAQRALFVIAAIVVSGVTVDVLKAILARLRPMALFAETPQYGFAFFKIGYKYNSFPSGHATTTLAVACALSLLYPRLRLLWFAVAAVVASSRVIVGAHFPGDVLAGAWFGTVITLALSRSAWFRDALAMPANEAEHEAS